MGDLESIAFNRVEYIWSTIVDIHARTDNPDISPK